MQTKILLNDILQLNDLNNVRIRFNLMFRDNWNPSQLYSENELEILLEGQYWNNKRKYYREGQTTIGFLKLYDDLWLLFHVGEVTKDLNIYDGMGYEFKELSNFNALIGRLVIKFKNRSQTMIRLAETVIYDCEVHQILPDQFENDLFPGYDKVRLSWVDLNRIIYKEGWKVALENQKGVYLVTDTSNGKMYVGSAYGEEMILGRFKTYVRNGHGGNVELKKIGFDHIKSHFEYSILEIYKSTTDDKTILERESWWKEILKTRKFGYNLN